MHEGNTGRCSFYIEQDTANYVGLHTSLLASFERYVRSLRLAEVAKTFGSEAWTPQVLATSATIGNIKTLVEFRYGVSYSLITESTVAAGAI